MPTVPTYDSPQVAPNTLPQARLAAPDMPDIAGRQAQQLGESLLRTGQGLAQIAQDKQNETNQTRVIDAMTQAVKVRTDLQVEALSFKGKNALERPDNQSLPDEYSGKLGKALDAIEQGLGNDAQKQAFRREAAQLGQQFYGALSAHMVGEQKVYKQDTQDAVINAAVNQASLLWGDESMRKQSADAIRATVDEMAADHGWDDKIKQAKYADALSPMHAGVIQGMVDADRVDLARAYYDENTPTMSMAVRARAMNLIDAGDFEKRTQDAAGSIYAQAGGNAAEALKLAREKFSGKDEDAVVTRIKTLDAERVTLRERAQKDAADQAWRIYSQSGGLGRIPASVISGMDGRDLEALRRTARADAEARLVKSEVKTDPNVYYFLTTAAAQDPNFAKEDLRRYFDKLSPADRKHFINMQARVAKPGEADQITTATQQKAAIIKALGLNGEKSGIFMQQADRALLAAQQEKGSALNQAERQKVLDSLALAGSVPGNWFGTNATRAFEAQAQGKPFTPEWDDAQVRKATAALQRQGVKNPTKQQIEATLRAAYGVK